MLPKTTEYTKSHDRHTKWMYFFTEEDDLLEEHNIIWDRVSTNIKKTLIASLSITNFF